jgi:hypothetical protein
MVKESSASNASFETTKTEVKAGFQTTKVAILFSESGFQTTKVAILFSESGFIINHVTAMLVRL